MLSPHIRPASTRKSGIFGSSNSATETSRLRRMETSRWLNQGAALKLRRVRARGRVPAHVSVRSCRRPAANISATEWTGRHREPMRRLQLHGQRIRGGNAGENKAARGGRQVASTTIPHAARTPISGCQPPADRPCAERGAFYSMDVERDLFSRVVLVRRWGRLGTFGKVRLDEHPDSVSVGPRPGPSDQTLSSAGSRAHGPVAPDMGRRLLVSSSSEQAAVIRLLEKPV